MQNPAQQTGERLFFLRECEIFQHLTSEELERLADRAPDRVVRAGEFVFSGREDAMAFYLLKKGKVKLVRISRDGNERIEEVLFPCDVFGMFFDDPRGEDQEVDLRAEALMDSLVVAVDGPILLDLIRRSPPMALGIIHTLVDRLRDSQRRLDRLYFDTSRSRLAKYLVDLAEQHGRDQGDQTLLDLPLNQEELGELIGASRVTVNQLLGEFKREGLLEVSRGTYSIHMDRLRSLV